MFIPGGRLRYGSRDIAGTQAVAALRGAGFTVASIDYRLTPESKLPEMLKVQQMQSHGFEAMLYHRATGSERTRGQQHFLRKHL